MHGKIVGLLLCLSACALSAPAPSAQAPATPSKSLTCNINRASATEGELLLVGEKYKEADAFYSAAIQKDATSEEAHLGKVRALIGENKVLEARAAADAMLNSNAHSALAEIALSESAFRAGDALGADAYSRTAVQLDACEGRAFAALGDVEWIAGYRARAATHYTRAHALRPTDEVIRRDWIGTLPRAQRLVELQKYRGESSAISDEDKRNVDNSIEHLKAYRPGECHATNRGESVKTPMQPVYGDSSRAHAFGLDVTFDGKRRRMQIDTGASGIVLTSGAARGLGLTPEFHTMTGGVGEKRSASYLSHVQSIKIGSTEFVDCMVEVIEKSQMDVDGLIGMDVFGQWLVTLDYQNAQLRLGPLPARPTNKPAPAQNDTALQKHTPDALTDDADDDRPQDPYISPELKDWQPILRIGHNILLPIGKEAKRDHFIIMDTGAGQTVLSVPFARSVAKLHDSAVEFRGVSAKVERVYEIDQVSFNVANLRLPAQPYYAFDTTNISHSMGFEVAGLFGLPTLQRLTIEIDYRDNLLKLSYDPQHDVRRF